MGSCIFKKRPSCCWLEGIYVSLSLWSWEMLNACTWWGLGLVPNKLYIPPIPNKKGVGLKLSLLESNGKLLCIFFWVGLPYMWMKFWDPPTWCFKSHSHNCVQTSLSWYAYYLNKFLLVFTFGVIEPITVYWNKCTYLRSALYLLHG